MPQQPELQPLAPTPRRKSSLHIRGQDSRRTVSERRHNRAPTWFSYPDLSCACILNMDGQV